jgi:hypothetical protein
LYRSVFVHELLPSIRDRVPMTEAKVAVLEPYEEKLYTFAMIAGRWGVHQKVAARRVKALGLPLVRWNQRTACVRLSDILEAERKATV